jgi:hypothetical protein
MDELAAKEDETIGQCDESGREVVDGGCAFCAEDRAAGERFTELHGMPWAESNHHG